MLEKLYQRLWYRTKNDFSKANTHEVETSDDDEYTDEIEKALWDIKDCLDLPTEEIEVAVASRHKCIKP